MFFKMKSLKWTLHMAAEQWGYLKQEGIETTMGISWTSCRLVKLIKECCSILKHGHNNLSVTLTFVCCLFSTWWWLQPEGYKKSNFNCDFEYKSSVQLEKQQWQVSTGAADFWELGHYFIYFTSSFPPASHNLGAQYLWFNRSLSVNKQKFSS